MIAFEVIKILFACAFGACVGSLINVLAYRIPRGLDYVTPTSRCPECDTPLTWRENIPIFGWLTLRGKCRFCGTPISAEYPIVEAFVAAVWGLTFLICYADPFMWHGRLLEPLRPVWSDGFFSHSWPIYVIVVMLFSSLVAMTLVDAKTYTIPPVLTNVPTALSVGHVAFAIWVQYEHGALIGRPDGWSIWIPTPHDWDLIGGAIGGIAGLVIANLLLTFGVLKRSFADYEQWEQAHAAAQPVDPAADPNAEPNSDPAMWIAYPHARREMLREMLFLGPPVALGLAGAALAVRLGGPWILDANAGVWESAHPASLWLRVLAGVLIGYLVGGGVVWAMRIVGSLAFGKEAMGLGDVHMMAAVGACLGWIDPVLAFFGAAFLGMGWWALGMIFRRMSRRVMPFGPFLAMGTLIVWFAKPGLSWLISRAMDESIVIP